VGYNQIEDGINGIKLLFIILNLDMTAVMLSSYASYVSSTPLEHVPDPQVEPPVVHVPGTQGPSGAIDFAIASTAATNSFLSTSVSSFMGVSLVSLGRTDIKKISAVKRVSDGGGRAR
jgi:hypothetical protein